MSQKHITVTNSNVHNLKNVSVEIPKNKLTVITGLSGSGKSSLAFDTIYAEGQRRYAESLSAYARQFMDVQDKPDVEDITGLSPTIAIDQKNISSNPRSTVGTATEIYDLIRLLFARAGVQYDPETGDKIAKYSAGEITELMRERIAEKHDLLLYAPIVQQGTVTRKHLLSHIEPLGYDTVRLNGIDKHISEVANFSFDKDTRYDIDLLVGRILATGKQQNVAELVEKILDLTNGFLTFVDEVTGEEETLSTIPFNPKTGREFEPIESRSFSFNSPHGACERCTGLGYTMEVDPELAIPNPRLTLGEGAIQPWTRIVGNQQFYHDLLCAVAEAHNFSMDTAVEKLPQKTMDLVLYGTDGQQYEVSGKMVHFEGVIPNLTVRYTETDSDYVKKEIENYMRDCVCPVCNGKRLKKESLAVRIGDFSIGDVVDQTVEELVEWFVQLSSDKKTSIQKQLTSRELSIAVPIAKEISKRLSNLMQVGLYYLTLDRSLTTISGGEAQRIRLASQLSTGLTDVIYILDEPSIGLHPKDNDKLIDTMKTLRDLGNTVIVVEHDTATVEAADYVIDMGPGAGERGGEIIAEGTPAQIKKDKNSITGQYITGKESIPVPKKYRKGNGKAIEVKGATSHNLKNIDVSFPLGTFLCVTGMSGSGKSTLVTDILSKSLHKHFFRAKAEPGPHEDIKGITHLDKVITIDQKPIGRTPRSNPATYTGIFTPIRDLFADLPEAKMRGMNPGTFSFNVKGGGRCEACSGDGYVRIPMQFLTDVFVECNECEGKRYNREALQVHYRQKTIADVLEMTIDEAYRFFNDQKTLAEKLQVLRDVGLGYLKLGQSATTLSGGEAQRIKLATELGRRSTGKTLYILDEPTTGLHMDDIKRLLVVLNKLVDKGNTVMTIEHNLDVIKSADWVIDMGPEGGKRGGEVVAEGTPTDVAKVAKSLTGKYLKEMFAVKKK